MTNLKKSRTMSVAQVKRMFKEIDRVFPKEPPKIDNSYNPWWNQEYGFSTQTVSECAEFLRKFRSERKTNKRAER